MKVRDFNIILIYYLIGSIIQIFLIRIQSYWYLAIVPITIYLLIKANLIIKGNINSLLIYVCSLGSLFFNFINSNFSIIPFNIITNQLFCKYEKKEIFKIFKWFRYITYLSILVYLVKGILTGSILGVSPFLFSKNMIILPFLPFMIFYHFNNRNNIDRLTYVLLLIIFLLSFSIGNTILAVMLFISLFLPNLSLIDIFKNINLKTLIVNKRFFSKLIIALVVSIIVIVPIITLYNFFALNLSSSEFESIRDRVSFLFDNRLLTEIDIFTLSPRLSILIQYISSLSISKLFTGNPDILFQVLLGPPTDNPHNSLVLAHMNMGIFGIIFYINIFIRILYLFIKKNIKVSFLALAITLRSFSDIILVLSGFSSFVLFFLLFNNYLLNHAKNYRKNLILETS